MFGYPGAPSEYDFHAPTIADQHAQWHQVHGNDAVCPLDCGTGENHDDANTEDTDPLDNACDGCNAEPCRPLCVAAGQQHDVQAPSNRHL